jgi:hypothetical protein
MLMQIWHWFLTNIFRYRIYFLSSCVVESGSYFRQLFTQSFRKLTILIWLALCMMKVFSQCFNVE